MVDALLTEQRERLTMDSQEPAMAGGVSTPALEKWRETRAQIEIINLAQRRGELVPRDTADSILSVAASKLRRFGEWLHRRDAEAGQRLEQTLAELESDPALAEVGRDGGPA